MKDNKELIISLIKDDLINTKLISGLENLGIDAELYLLGISDAIFVLMGIDDSKKGEKLFEYYLELRQEVEKIKPKCFTNQLGKLAEEIYNKLLIVR